LNFYRRFPGDYQRDTQQLTFEEHGAYTLLLDIAYTTEKPLPNDRRLIYRMTRALSPSDKAAIDLVIRDFFKKTRHGYIHKRVREEISHAESRILASKANGKRGGRPKTQRKPGGLFLGSVSDNLDITQEKSSPDSRLPDNQTPSSSIQSSQNHLAAAVYTSPIRAAAASFLAIGFDKPFGDRRFQTVWLEEYNKPAEWVTMKMEATIQRCQEGKIGVPPQFFTAKRNVENEEAATFDRRHKRAPL
jgi:uncharacterized protein YdaU (DUF1376 family)